MYVALFSKIRPPVPRTRFLYEQHNLHGDNVSGARTVCTVEGPTKYRPLSVMSKGLDFYYQEGLLQQCLTDWLVKTHRRSSRGGHSILT